MFVFFLLVESKLPIKHIMEDWLTHSMTDQSPIKMIISFFFWLSSKLPVKYHGRLSDWLFPSSIYYTGFNDWSVPIKLIIFLLLVEFRLPIKISWNTVSLTLSQHHILHRFQWLISSHKTNYFPSTGWVQTPNKNIMEDCLVDSFSAAYITPVSMTEQSR